MPNYSALDRLQLKVLTKAASLMMAPPATRDAYDQFTMTVHAVTELSPRLRRITFRANEFADYARTGPDESFVLLMPANGRDEVVMPSVDRMNIRQAIRQLPEADRPDMRWYTIRAWRQEQREIDVDFVLHGDAGPGTRWASAAEPGQTIGFRAGSASYRPPVGGGVELLAADETALPALSTILETGTSGTPQVFVELPDESFRGPLDADVPITWLYRGDEAPGSRLLPAVRDADLSTVDYAWLCGESAIATGLRRQLVRDRGVDRRRILFSGYWKVGQARF